MPRREWEDGLFAECDDRARELEPEAVGNVVLDDLLSADNATRNWSWRVGADSVRWCQLTANKDCRTFRSTAFQSELNRSASEDEGSSRRAASGKADDPRGRDDGKRLQSATIRPGGSPREDLLAELDELVDAFLPRALRQLGEAGEERVDERLKRRPSCALHGAK